MLCHNSQPKSTTIAAAPDNATKTIANNDKTPPPLADHPRAVTLTVMSYPTQLTR